MFSSLGCIVAEKGDQSFLRICIRGESETNIPPIFDFWASVSQMAVWVARITQHTNHFPIDGGYMRDSTADASAKRAQRGCKRKAQSFVQVDSASASISKVERILKCPKLAAVRERIMAKSV